MKAISISSAVRVVEYHGINVEMLRDERYLAVDKNGEIWAHYDEPIIRPHDAERGQWGLSRCAKLPRIVGVVDLEGLEWAETLKDYGLDIHHACRLLPS